MAEIRVINPNAKDDKKIKVCAYARVSSDSTDQLNSFVEQVRHYNEIIKKNKNWTLVEIYADEGITGLQMSKRDEFMRMLSDCRKGKINKILAKSISRFSRNTKECIETIRELKELDIDIEFEKEKINTGSVSSELFITVIGAMAQEESISISKNMRWSYLNRMKNGDFITCKAPYGFRLNKKEFEVHEEEGKIVSWIFDSYINGMGKRDIADDLTRRKIPKRDGDTNWSYHMVRYILKNEKYMGDVLLQKRFTTDVLPFRLIPNKGQKAKYYVSESNIPIVSKEVYEKAQEINDSHIIHSDIVAPIGYPLSKKIICASCGKMFRHRISRNIIYWSCRSYNQSKSFCNVKQIREQEIYNAFIRMYNILKSNNLIILSPLLNQLQELRDKALKNNKVAEIEKQILDLSEQTLVLNRLRSKEILDPAVFMSQVNKIEKDISNLRQMKRQQLEFFDRDQDIITTQILIDIIENGTPQITQFDESLFNDLVDHVKVGEKDEVIFHLINGLELTEKIERKVI